MGTVIPIRRRNDEYIRQACEYLPLASYAGALEIYRELLNDPHLDDTVIAAVAEADRYFLLTNVLRVGQQNPRIYHPWVYDRCREVEAEPDNCLDLWAREHWKSTIITFAGSFQEIIRSKGEITIGIFSHNTAHSRDKFVVRIKREQELNPLLHQLWPTVFWVDPKREAPVWSRDAGIVVNRDGNPSEPTVSGWGLVDGQPTGSHFGLIIYDDVVTEKAVTSAEMIIKTTEMWELSTFMTQEQPDGARPRVWYIGTRYNFADTYGVMLARKVAKPRVHPATDTGTKDGTPVYLSDEQWQDKVKKTSIRTLSCQMLQNPIAGEEQELKPEWIRRYDIRPETLNVAILTDPADSKDKGSCNSAFIVIGMDAAWNKYLLDGAIHKMDLGERWTMLKYLRNKWLSQPGIQVVQVGYEKYGMQADISHFEQMMQIEQVSFSIEEVNWPRDRQSGAKDDRIRRLIPDHQNWKFFYPEVLYDPTSRTFNYDPAGTRRQLDAIRRGKPYLVAQKILRKDENGRLYNLVQRLIDNEYLFFPATTSKDGLDAASRFYDLDIKPPQIVRDTDTLPEAVGDD